MEIKNFGSIKTKQQNFKRNTIYNEYKFFLCIYIYKCVCVQYLNDTSDEIVSINNHV